MKYKLMGIVSMICLLISGVVLTSAKSDNPNNRIHQHLTAQVTSEDCEGEEEFCTHLPLVIIDTGGEEIPGEPIRENGSTSFTLTDEGETMLSAKISIISDETKVHHLTDEPDLESNILIRIRGNSSRNFDKKGYLVRLTDSDGTYRNEEVMGMAAHYEWALHGPYLDKSLIRNYMWYNITGEIMDYAPNVRFCEVVLNGELKIAQTRAIEGINQPINMISQVRGQYFLASKYNFWVLDDELKPTVSAEIDPWFSANVLDIVGITPYQDDAFVLMGTNKSLLRARLNPNADDVKGWANFVEGRTQVEAVGGLGRARIDTERAKYSYIHSSATDGRYIFTATVPDNRNHKTFVISKALMADWTLSAEFVPGADLKDGRTLGELYVTGMVYEDGKLYAVSKNFNTLLVIDIAAEEVTAAYAIPAELTDIRGLVKKGNQFEVVDHNKIVTLTLQ